MENVRRLLALVVVAALAGCAGGGSNSSGTNTGTDPGGGGIDPGGGTDPGTGTTACTTCPAGQTCGGGGVPSRCGTMVPVCADGWCWSTPLPQGNHLNGVSARSPSDVFAVGDQGTILHWTGDRLEAMASPTRRSLKAVWAAPGVQDAWAVGDASVILHFDGNAWTKEYGPVEQQFSTTLNAVFGTSLTDVWAVGDQGRILHRGASGIWTSATSPAADTAGLRAVWASGPNDVLVVSEDYSYGTHAAYRWNGATWSRISLPYAGAAVWGSGPSDVWIVGSGWVFGGLTYHWDGTKWASATSTGTGQALAGTGAADVWSADSYTIRHFDGTRWSEVKLPTGVPSIHAVASAGPGAAWVVGENGAILHSTGGTFVPVSQGTVAPSSWGRFTELSGAGGAIWAVGHATIGRFDGTSWTIDVTRGADDVWAVAADDVWFAGTDATYSTVQHWNGTSYETSLDARADATAPNAGELSAIWAAPGGEVWAFAADGHAALHRKDGVWSLVDLETPLPALWDVEDAFGTASDLYLIGNMVAHWDGASWSRLPTSDWAYFGWKGDDLWLSGYHASGNNLASDENVFRVSGTTWTPTFADGTFYSGAITGLAPADLYVCDQVGWLDPGSTTWLNGVAVFRWNGSGYGRMHPPVATIEQLFAQPSGYGFADTGVWAATTDGNGGVLVFRP
jgi:hypothetical protein